MGCQGPDPCTRSWIHGSIHFSIQGSLVHMARSRAGLDLFCRPPPHPSLIEGHGCSCCIHSWRTCLPPQDGQVRLHLDCLPHSSDIGTWTWVMSGPHMDLTCGGLALHSLAGATSLKLIAPAKFSLVLSSLKSSFLYIFISTTVTMYALPQVELTGLPPYLL